jgi:hypothetical protein
LETGSDTLDERCLQSIDSSTPPGRIELLLLRGWPNTCWFFGGVIDLEGDDSVERVTRSVTSDNYC